MNSDLIKNVKIFNLGSPQFLLKLTTLLYPKVCMKNDIIVRRGEIAEEFFIIKKGKVEVLATDETTVISILSSGSYFGEIGLLWLKKRSVSVRALTNCIFLCLNKTQFTEIMDNYEDIKEHLYRVG